MRRDLPSDLTRTVLVEGKGKKHSQMDEEKEKLGSGNSHSDKDLKDPGTVKKFLEV